MGRKEEARSIGIIVLALLVMCGFAFAQNWGSSTGGGTGDMTKAVYDANGNNVVDTATTLITNATVTTPTLTSPRINGTISGDPHFSGTVTGIAGFTGGTVPSAVTFTGNSTLATGAYTPFIIAPTLNMSGNSSSTSLLINRTETSIGSGAQLLIDAQVGGVSKFKVSNAGTIYTPSIQALTSGINLVLGNNGNGYDVEVSPTNSGTFIVKSPHKVGVGGGIVSVGYNGIQFPDFQSASINYRNDYPTDSATGTFSVLGNNAYTGAATNVDGGSLIFTAGAGASSSVGDADGGAVTINGGAGYGTGDHGDVNLATTRGIVNIGNTKTNASGTQYSLKITPTLNQSGTAAATDLLINRTETSVGSGFQNYIVAQTGGVSRFTVSAAGNIEAAGNFDLAGYSTGNGPIYAGLRIDGTTGITEALTNATYVEIIDAALVAAPCVATHTSCDATNDNVDIVTAGTYDVSFEMSFSVDGTPSSELVSCAVFKEGAILESVSFDRTISSTAYGVAVARGIVAVSANDTFDVRCSIADASPPNMLVAHMGMTLVRLGD